VSNWRRVWLLQVPPGVGDRAEEVSVPVRQSVQPVVVETQNTNNAILEAIQSLSVRFDGRSNRIDAVEQGRQPMPVHLHGRNGAGASSLPSSRLPFPTNSFPNEPFGGDPGDDGEGENDDEEELIQDGSPQLPKEKSLIPALCVMPKSIPFHPQLRALEVGKQFDFASGSFGY